MRANRRIITFESYRRFCKFYDFDIKNKLICSYTEQPCCEGGCRFWKLLPKEKIIKKENK